MTDAKPVIGFVGLGRMGMPMARNVLAGGYELVVFDLDASRVKRLVEAGAAGAPSAAEVVRRGEVIMTSLPSSAVTVKVLRDDLLPHARAGQVFLDMGTTEAPETRRLSAAFRERAAELLDCPVSGPPGATMRVLVGGRRDVADRIMPILKTTADPLRVVYCGESSTGQAVKAVNQLGMGLVDAAIIEAVAFGVRAGADVDAIIQGVGGEDGWRSRLADVARLATDGRADDVYVKFPELPYFLTEAAARGFESPLMSALWEFLDKGPRNWKDNMERPRVAMWHQLMARGAKPTA